MSAAAISMFRCFCCFPLLLVDDDEMNEENR